MTLFAVVAYVAVAVTVALVLAVVFLLRLPKRRVWPVPEGLGAVPSMRPADRRKAA